MFTIYKSVHEKIILDENITIKILGIKEKNVYLGLIAPKYAMFGKVKSSLRKIPKNDRIIVPTSKHHEKK